MIVCGSGDDEYPKKNSPLTKHRLAAANNDEQRQEHNIFVDLIDLPANSRLNT